MVTLRIASDRQNIVPIIQSAIAASLKRMEIGLRKTEREIQKFETKYRVPSEQFLSSYAAEDLDGNDDEYVSWMGELKLRDALREEFQALSEIEYVPDDSIMMTSSKDRLKLLDLFGSWDGEIDDFLQEFSERREVHGNVYF